MGEIIMAVFATSRPGSILNGVGVINPGAFPNGSGYIDYRAGYEELTDPSGSTLYTNLNGRYLAEGWVNNETPLISAADYNSASSGVDATVYLAAQAGRSHVLFGVAYSYAGTPTAGTIQIQSPSGTVVFNETTTSAGSFPFQDGLKFPKGNDVRVTLTHAGSNGVKNVSITGRRTE
jgi:hypothetical protein